MMNTTADRIKRRREELGMSQEVLSGLSSVSQGQISKYEKGIHEPTADALANIAKALETSTDWLVGMTDIAGRPLRGSGDLASDERILLEIYRRTPINRRDEAVQLLKVIAG